MYRREGGLHACFLIRHDDHMHILPDGPEYIVSYLRSSGLIITGEPYFIGQIPLFENGEKVFYATLYIPVKKQTSEKEK